MKKKERKCYTGCARLTSVSWISDRILHSNSTSVCLYFAKNYQSVRLLAIKEAKKRAKKRNER